MESTRWQNTNPETPESEAPSQDDGQSNYDRLRRLSLDDRPVLKISTISVSPLKLGKQWFLGWVAVNRPGFIGECFL